MEEIKNTLLYDIYKKFPKLASPETIRLYASVQRILPESQKNSGLTMQKPKKNPDNSIYSGQVDKQGQKSGVGVLVISESEVYEGNFKENQIKGFGRLFSKDLIYIGTWEGEVLESPAEIMNMKENYFYEGEVLEKKPHGRGQKKKTDEWVYTGEFKNGYMQGIGEMVWETLEEYKGNFQLNRQEGKGEFRWPDGSFYEGDWEKSKMHGKGTYFYKDEYVYNGEFINGLKQGFGICKWSNGKSFEGYWMKDRYDGIGKETSEIGKIVNGIWRNGNIINEENMISSEVKKGQARKLRRNKHLMTECPERKDLSPIPQIYFAESARYEMDKTESFRGSEGKKKISPRKNTENLSVNNGSEESKIEISVKSENIKADISKREESEKKMATTDIFARKNVENVRKSGNSVKLDESEIKFSVKNTESEIGISKRKTSEKGTERKIEKSVSFGNIEEGKIEVGESYGGLSISREFSLGKKDNLSERFDFLAENSVKVQDNQIEQIDDLNLSSDPMEPNLDSKSQIEMEKLMSDNISLISNKEEEEINEFDAGIADFIHSDYSPAIKQLSFHEPSQNLKSSSKILDKPPSKNVSNYSSQKKSENPPEISVNEPPSKNISIHSSHKNVKNPPQIPLEEIEIPPQIPVKKPKRFYIASSKALDSLIKNNPLFQISYKKLKSLHRFRFPDAEFEENPLEDWIELPKSKLYKGSVNTNNLPHGRGLLLQRGRIYFGEFSNGKKNGLGRCISALGQLSEGYWRNGKKYGFGVFEGHEEFYCGDWENGLFHGLGVLENSNGVYNGRFIYGVCEGIGELTYNDGKVYKGEFRNGVPDGYGDIQFGSKINEGYWKKGKPLELEIETTIKVTPISEEKIVKSLEEGSESCDEEVPDLAWEIDD